ncbi:MAG: hypothetical protein ACYTEQ_16755 [Planctomycetota bacterium]|jgi:hypothetical protein
MPPQNTPIVKRGDYTGSGIQAAIWSPEPNVTAYVTDVIISSGSDVKVDLKFGSTGVSVLYTARLDADAMPMHSHSFKAPLHGDTEEAITVDVSATADVEVTLTGYEQFRSA